VATASNKGGAKERFEKFDVENDGFISRAEFLKQQKK
jgi:Ca2+-binding EF-hand superfamily protein